MALPTLEKTALFSWHVDHGAKMVDFAGWSMPIQYGSIVDEHCATRRAVTLFDVSHMGRLRFHGDRAAEFLDRLVTRRVADLKDGQIKYGLVTNQQGGILDDVLVYRIADPTGNSVVSMVVNASNRQKILDWLQSHQPLQWGVRVEDLTTETCMIAVQGPAAIKLLSEHLDFEVGGLAYYRGRCCRFHGVAITCSRTGYTGEDGCELIVPSSEAVSIWESLFKSGRGKGMLAAGLAARDTLRLEAAMPLYGHELNENINPIEAGLEFAVNLKDREFIGRSALLAAINSPSGKRRIGLRLSDRRVPREGYAIYADDREVGVVTSGTFSPTLDCPIAMGYVPQQHAVEEKTLVVDIRGKQLPAEVVKLPFYKRQSS
jgi:aminomethyltransferase